MVLTVQVTNSLLCATQLATSSTMSLCTRKTCHARSASGIFDPVMKGRNRSDDQFSGELPPTFSHAAEVRGHCISLA